MTLDAVSLSARVRRKGATVTAKITVVDDQNAAIDGALVSATWSVPKGSSVAAVADTNNEGEAKLRVSEGLGTYTIVVNNVEKDGYQFAPEGVELTYSIVVD
jgi:hypothetical protein